ncbi:MAG: PLP-dependent aminotransferase family protein, partial [Mycetocola sp.]
MEKRRKNGGTVTDQGSQASTGNNLDPWYSNYAERTSGLAASEVRALFAVAS